LSCPRDPPPGVARSDDGDGPEPHPHAGDDSPHRPRPQQPRRHARRVRGPRGGGITHMRVYHFLPAHTCIRPVSFYTCAPPPHVVAPRPACLSEIWAPLKVRPLAGLTGRAPPRFYGKMEYIHKGSRCPRGPTTWGGEGGGGRYNPPPTPQWGLAHMKFPPNSLTHAYMHKKEHPNPPKQNICQAGSKRVSLTFSCLISVASHPREIPPVRTQCIPVVFRQDGRPLAALPRDPGPPRRGPRGLPQSHHSG